MSNLRRYWFKFERLPVPAAVNLGCGVTAHSRDDALALVKERVFGTEKLPPLVEVVDDVDVSSLERKHVLPNLGNLRERGIWFPQGYDRPLEGPNSF
jgi:hypothetical protein